MKVLLDECIWDGLLCLCSVFYSVILLLLWYGYGQGGGFACMYLAFYKANLWVCAPLVNNIYVMYIVLCESIIPILLLSKFLFKSAIPWTRKFSGRQRWNASMSFIYKVYSSKYKTRQKPWAKDLSTVQPMDEQIFNMSNPWTIKCIRT